MRQPNLVSVFNTWTTQKKIVIEQSAEVLAGRLLILWIFIKSYANPRLPTTTCGDFEERTIIYIRIGYSSKLCEEDLANTIKQASLKNKDSKKLPIVAP